jgi:hypothetical protein
MHGRSCPPSPSSWRPSTNVNVRVTPTDRTARATPDVYRGNQVADHMDGTVPAMFSRESRVTALVRRRYRYPRVCRAGCRVTKLEDHGDGIPRHRHAGSVTTTDGEKTEAIIARLDAFAATLRSRPRSPRDGSVSSSPTVRSIRFRSFPSDQTRSACIGSSWVETMCSPNWTSGRPLGTGPRQRRSTFSSRQSRHVFGTEIQGRSSGESGTPISAGRWPPEVAINDRARARAATHDARPCAKYKFICACRIRRRRARRTTNTRVIFVSYRAGGWVAASVRL